MRQRRVPGLQATVFGLLMALLLGPLASARAETVVLDVREYARSTGQPNVFTATFPACRPDRAFRLRLMNGPRGLTRVSSLSIALNGSEVVSPAQINQQVAQVERAVGLQEQNTLRVTLAGTPLGTVALSIVSDSGCGPTISAPTLGATVPAGPLLVRGSTESTGEVGITVNGIPALVDGTGFAAIVQAHPELTELVVVATTFDGSRAETRQALAVSDFPEPAVFLQIAPSGGPAPLHVTIGMVSRIPVARIALDLTGDGAVAFEGDTLDGQTFIYPTPGVYVPTVTVTDDQGVAHTARGLVHVLDVAALDARLQARWHAMKDALRQGDLTRALDAMTLDARDPYRDLLTALTIPLSQIDQALTDPTLVELDENRAEYQMVRMDNGEATSYFVLFVRDVDGVWRLKFF
jgi:hypothetical protein